MKLYVALFFVALANGPVFAAEELSPWFGSEGQDGFRLMATGEVAAVAGVSFETSVQLDIAEMIENRVQTCPGKICNVDPVVTSSIAP